MSTQASRSAARLMLSPAVILLLIWMIVPLALTLWFSFQRYNLQYPDRSGFIWFHELLELRRLARLLGRDPQHAAPDPRRARHHRRAAAS